MKPLRLNKKKIACAILAGMGALFYACILPVGNGAGLDSSGNLSSMVYDTTLSGVVQSIFNDKCVSCHAPGTSSYASSGNLDLTSGNAYTSLVNVATFEAPDQPPHFLVKVDSAASIPSGVPYSIDTTSTSADNVKFGNADSSYLYQKVLTLSSYKGSPSVRMPQSANPLSAGEISIIKRWIEKGAPQ